MRLEAGEAGFSPALTTKVQQSQELSLEKRRWLQQLVIQPGHVAEFQLRVDLTIHELQLGRAVGRQLRRRGLEDGPLLYADSLVVVAQRLVDPRRFHGNGRDNSAGFGTVCGLLY